MEIKIPHPHAPLIVHCAVKFGVDLDDAIAVAFGPDGQPLPPDRVVLAISAHEARERRRHEIELRFRPLPPPPPSTSHIIKRAIANHATVQTPVQIFLRLIDLFELGYTQEEMARAMHTSTTRINGYIKQLRAYLISINIVPDHLRKDRKDYENP